MPEFALRPRARADLDAIWDYTVEKWGYAQAEKYLRMLNQTFETLAQNAELGRIYNEVYEGLRVFPSGRHLIFYFATTEGIDVVRVLHERMGYRIASVPRRVVTIEEWKLMNSASSNWIPRAASEQYLRS